MSHLFNTDLDRNPANFQPLTPLIFLERAAMVMPDHIAIIHGKQKITYSEFFRNSRQLASALARQGIERGDTVSVLLPNIPPMLEAHHGVPMSGAVLHTINTRLDARTIAFQLDHANTRVLIVDRSFIPLAEAALALSEVAPLFIVHNDPEYSGSEINTLPSEDYSAFIEKGDPHFAWLMPEDEWDAISINYTSGTTGDPKGVVAHHRGAYLLAQGNALVANLPRHAVYLWTLPMFHCNGWCFPWTMSVVFGTHVCLREVRAEPIWQSINEHAVTHLCGAPAVMSVLITAAQEAQQAALPRSVEFFTAAAPPPEQVLADMETAGFNVTHLYGLTETYGPAVINEWQSQWNELDSEERIRFKARQGVRYLPLEALDVMDPDTMHSVPHDGKTMGEVMFRGNVVMKGYYRNPRATKEAFAGGWFHSGDLGVIHPDGYIQLKDRSKDIIISGGENISSIEVEDVLFKHPSVAGAAVVAMPHEKWGETPCAFIELQPGHTVTEKELLQHCRDYLAAYKIPRHFVFESIARTGTGKVQKYELRKRLIPMEFSALTAFDCLSDQVD
jgi:fatty-acyl-CoA synthase